MDGRATSWGERARAALETLGSAPWRRAPWLLRRRPGVLAATAGACAVLAASLSSIPLFLSSAGTEAVTVQAAERCPRDTGATSLIPPQTGSRLAAPDPFTTLDDKLGPAIQWGRLETTLTGPDPSQRTDVVVLYRDGAVDHVDVIEGSPRPGGVWVSDRLVEMAGVDRSASPTLGGVPTPIAGVYRDLSAGTIADPFWCAHRPDLLLQGPDLAPPPPVVLADRETWISLEGSADVVAVEAAWEAPLRDNQTVTATRLLVEELACNGADAGELTWCIGEGRLPDDASFVERNFGTSLPFVVDRAGSIQVAVAGGVWPVAAVAALAGAGLVAATALLWCDRRQREVALLTVRGLSPAALAVKAVLELAGALVLGSAAGVVLAYVLVVWIGPSPALEPAAVARAWWVGVVALVLSALVVTAVVVVRVPAGHVGHKRRILLRAVPWEAALVVAAALSFQRLDASGVPVSRGANVSRIDLFGLMFPLLFLSAVVAVVARVLGLALRPVKSISRNWPSPMFLAVRRVARYRAAVIGMVAASAVASGVLGYAATIQRSMDATLLAKAHTYLGSDVVVRVPQGEQIPAVLAGRSTVVDRYNDAWVDLPRRESVNVFAIDPTTFPQAAFWDASLAPVSLDEILERLAAPPTGARIPALIVGLDVPAIAEAGIVTGGTTRFEIAEIAEVQAFPGMRKGSPAMFVAASALEDVGLNTRVRETWIRGERAEILRTLDQARTAYEETSTTANVVDGVSSLTVTQTFGFMRSLGVAAAVLVVAGVALYFDARRRSRVLAHAFARRMGLTRRQHRRALLAEVLAGVGVGSWLGLVAALVGAGVAYERLDPLPTFRPDPLLRPATWLMVGLALAALVLASVAAAIAQRTTDRDDPLDVLRAGT